METCTGDALNSSFTSPWFFSQRCVTLRKQATTKSAVPLMAPELIPSVYVKRHEMRLGIPCKFSKRKSSRARVTPWTRVCANASPIRSRIVRSGSPETCKHRKWEKLLCAYLPSSVYRAVESANTHLARARKPSRVRCRALTQDIKISVRYRDRPRISRSTMAS